MDILVILGLGLSGAAITLAVTAALVWWRQFTDWIDKVVNHCG